MSFWFRLACLPAALLCAAGISTAARADDFGGGFPISTCISPAQREAIQAEIARYLRDAKRDVEPEASAGIILYADPMGGGGTNSSGKTIVNYVDLDPTAALQDYNCGVTTYDGHGGIDISILSFYDMDEGVPILCAAPGTVVYAHDGEFDRETAWPGSSSGNGVVVQHADGSQATYWHARTGSVAVSVGQPVATGQVLAKVGSAGFSSGPHIHFETYDGGRVDPYNGSCQGGASRWTSQLPYVWTLPFQMMDHGVTTQGPTWATVLEKPVNKNHFRIGRPCYAWVRLRNNVGANTLTWKWYQGGILKFTYGPTVTQTFSSSWWWAPYNIPNVSTAAGNWRVDVLLNGSSLIAQDFFTVNIIVNQAATVADRSFDVEGNTSLEDQFIATDPDGAAGVSWYRIESGPFHGTLVQDGGRARKFRYQPTTGFVGRDSVMVFTEDDELLIGPSGKYLFNVTQPLDVPRVASLSGARLHAPRPNPMSRGGELTYSLGKAARVRLELRDVTGRIVRVLEEGERVAGEHRVRWDGRDARARLAPAGVYFATLATPGHSDTRRIVSVQ